MNALRFEAGVNVTLGIEWIATTQTNALDALGARDQQQRFVARPASRFAMIFEPFATKRIRIA